MIFACNFQLLVSKFPPSFRAKQILKKIWIYYRIPVYKWCRLQDYFLHGAGVGSNWPSREPGHPNPRLFRDRCPAHRHRCQVGFFRIEFSLRKITRRFITFADPETVGSYLDPRIQNPEPCFQCAGCENKIVPRDKNLS